MREGEGWVAENIERMRKKRGSVYVFRRKEKEAKERGITRIHSHLLCCAKKRKKILLVKNIKYSEYYIIHIHIHYFYLGIRFVSKEH